MNRRSLLQAGAAAPVLLALGACATGADGGAATPPQSLAPPMPPVAKKEPFTVTQLGRTRTDDYHW